MIQTRRKIRFYYLLIVAIVVSLISLVLGLFNLLWWYFVIGAILSLLLHVMMIIQNDRFFRIQTDKFARELYSPKKDTILWYLLRLVIIAVVFAAVILITSIYYKEKLLEVSILFLSAYVLIKISFIVVIYIEGRR